MDNQTISPSNEEFNPKLSKFISNLVELNLQLISMNPKDIVDVNENGSPKAVKVGGLKCLMDQIGKIALLFQEHESMLRGELH